MKTLLLLLAWLLLCAATPLPPLESPDAVPLGAAVTLRYRLPESGLSLPGLPPLQGLQQLRPPAVADGLLTWQLLAVRPGMLRVPALILENARGQRWETAPLAFDVTAPALPAEASPAPLKPVTLPQDAPPRWPWLVLLLIPALWLVLRRRPRRFSPEDSDQRLARLAAELDSACGDEHPEITGLRQVIEALRFATVVPAGVDLDQLEQQVRALRDGGERV